MKPLAGQTALITGTSAPNGIGRAIAMQLATDGASVIVTDVAGHMALGDQLQDKADLMDDLVAQIEAEGGRALAHLLDVTDPGQIETCLSAAQDFSGHVSILVNNAGSLEGSDNFMNTRPAQWKTSFEINLLGPMMLCQAVIPNMQRAGAGRIINIGSTGSLGAEPGFGAYTTMKHGLVGLSKTIAAEFGPDGIRCNTVCPGYIMTDMHAAANTRLAAEADVT